jgi:type IV pilus assembly protein PilO
MPDLRHTRKNIRTALAIMAGVDLLALVIYISPLVGSPATRRQEINQLQVELNAKTRQVAPLKDLPQKVQLASHQIADFYNKRIPDQNSQIYAELGKLTAGTGVTIEGVKYKQKDEGADKQLRTGKLRPAELEVDLVGIYTALARFINAVERDDMFFIIDSVTIGGEPQGTVKLNVKLEAYLKAGA